MSESNEKKKPKVSKEEKRRRMIQQVSFLVGKLKRTSQSYEEGAYWEAVERESNALLRRPLD
jgi:hypothetical protein